MFNCSAWMLNVMYTTNAIEDLRRWLRQVTKTKGSFISNLTLTKLLFLVRCDGTVRWKKPLHNWNRILAELALLYDDRLRLDL